MSTMTGNTAGAGSGGKKLKLKLGGMPAPTAPGTAAGAAAPSMSTGTAGGSSLAGAKKVRIKLGGAGVGQQAAAGSPGAAAPAPAGPVQVQAAAAAMPPVGGSHDLQPGDQQLHYAASQQQQQQYVDAAMQQQYYQQYGPAWQQQYPGYDPSMLQQYQAYDGMQYDQQAQHQHKVKLQTKSKLAAAGPGPDEPRYTATGRVQRKASKGLARLIAEEGGVPTDHSHAAPPPHVWDIASADSPLQERRSARAVKSKAIDESYVDPETMDFEGQEWVLPDDPQPKVEKPKREPRPKKPRPERPASTAPRYAEDEEDYEALDLAMEDDVADEDYEAAEDEEEAREVKVRRGGASRAPAAAAMATERRPRRAAAAGVSALVAAHAREGGYGDAAAAAAQPSYAHGAPHSPSPPLQQQGWDAAPAAAAAAGSGKSAGRKRGVSKGRSSSRAADSDEDYWDDLTDESDEGLTAWDAGEDDDGACFGAVLLGGGYKDHDYTNLSLKPDHYNRPLWVCDDGRIFLETYSPIYKQAYDFLIAIAEPVCRPESIHEYVLTPQSLYAAVSVGLDQQTILGVLDKLSKVKLSPNLHRIIANSTRSYGKVKLVLKHNRFWVETADPKVLEKLLKNPVVRAARAWDTPGADAKGLVRRAAIKEHAAARLAQLTLAAATEGVTAAAGASQEAGKTAQPAVQQPGVQPAAAPPAAPAAAAAGGGGRFVDPFGDSESESDPEDFTGVARKRPQPEAGSGPSATPAEGPPDSSRQAAGKAAVEAAPGAAAASDSDDEDMLQVSRKKPRMSSTSAGDGTAAAAAAPGQSAAAADSDADSDELPTNTRRQRQKQAGSAADDASDMSELDEADLEAAAAEPDAGGAQQAEQAGQQPRPVLRGRLAATAAVAAATSAPAGDGTAQALLALGDDAAGYEDVEEEEDPEREVVAFEINAADVEKVKKECLPGSSGLDCPLLEEYDFAHDTANKGLDIHLKRGVELRPYQDKSLSKMFGNGRARSGIIVLPCGAGKSLVGVAAAARVKKATLVLCTSSVSVDQWAYQFTLWTNLDQDDVVKFTAGGGGDAQAEANKERLKEPCVCVTTFNMIAHKGKRSAYGEEMMRLLSSREWGLLVMDEVHVVPARMFRQVISIIKAHCKLGLTATLVREDELIGDLNFLIGPKMYEANWLDLTRSGHIANVQCVEVWCPMTKEFMTEYLERESKNDSIKQLLYVMNPNKFMVCQYLIDWHERIRGDKVIVFSDNVWALEVYARALNKPYIYGKTSHAERTAYLAAFKHSRTVNTIFLSKVGDNSLDIPEANVLIQISSHAGSRRQEAQRLGRILRAKKGRPGGAEEEEFSAFFYTLVSRDTQEMYYSAKRQQFLVDQGYAFKVLPNLHEQAQKEAFIAYRTQVDQLRLLNQVINSKGEVESLEKECSRFKEEAGDKYDLVAKQGTWGRGKGRRVGARSMAHASGGGEFVYNEWQRGACTGKQMISGPQGAVAKQEREAKTKKIRQQLARG